MEDNKKTISNYNENKLINGYLIKDQDLSFIIRKSEKVATAVYMISNFFNTEEPLKWELRKGVTKLLKNIMSFSDSSLAGKEILNSKVAGDFLEINTLFNLAYNSGFISQMNFEIVSSEISLLSKTVESYCERQISGTKTLFKTEYFEVKKDLPVKDTNYQSKPNAGFLKDNIKDTIKDIKDTQNNKVVFNGKKSELESFFNNIAQPDANYKPATQSKLNSSTLSDRELKILEKVKTSGPVTIKDISEMFTNVSEKTIQRELQKMHDAGHIKKEGERRWTKYFI